MKHQSLALSEKQNYHSIIIQIVKDVMETAKLKKVSWTAMQIVTELKKNMYELHGVTEPAENRASELACELQFSYS